MSLLHCTSLQHCVTHITCNVAITTIKYSTVQYSSVQYSSVQYSSVQYSTVQWKGDSRLGPEVASPHRSSQSDQPNFKLQNTTSRSLYCVQFIEEDTSQRLTILIEVSFIEGTNHRGDSYKCFFPRGLKIYLYTS